MLFSKRKRNKTTFFIQIVLVSSEIFSLRLIPNTYHFPKRRNIVFFLDIFSYSLDRIKIIEWLIKTSKSRTFKSNKISHSIIIIHESNFSVSMILVFFMPLNCNGGRM